MDGQIKTKKPVILISSSYSENKNGSASLSLSDYYPAAIEKSGGFPVIASSHVENIQVDLFDGLLLSGGCDVHPSYYGDDIMAGNCTFSSERDRAEFALVKAFIDAGKSVFGICRGMQLLNVALGGTLNQDIKNHRTEIPSSRVFHRVEKNLSDGCDKFSFLPDSFIVNSYHHQSLSKLGSGFVPMFFSDDGTIEAIVHEKLPLSGVQWHPERSLPGGCDHDLCYDCSHLIEYFVTLCPKQ